MMLFAEHLRLRRVYFLDDDIGEFFQYNRNRVIRDYKVTNVAHTLNFMREALDAELNKQCFKEPSKEDIREWRAKAYQIINCENPIEDLKNNLDILLEYVDSLSENKDKILDLLTIINREEFNDMKNFLSGEFVENIGNVSLINRNSRSNVDNKLKLDKENKNIR